MHESINSSSKERTQRHSSTHHPTSVIAVWLCPTSIYTLHIIAITHPLESTLWQTNRLSKERLCKKYFPEKGDEVIDQLLR